jgi:hypothetical protein
MSFCNECLQPMTKKHCDITLKRAGIGEYTTIGVLHFGCDICGAKVIPPMEAKRIEVEGIKIHLLKILREQGPLSVLILRETLQCDTLLLKEAIDVLYKQNKVSIEGSDEFPIIEIRDIFYNIKEPLIKRILERIKKWMK